ncbi:MAG: carbohydrate binding domain-containing protein, partial [Flavobacteriaceae bacterium]
MKTSKSTALILMFFFVGLSYAQELYTNANAASIANEANSTSGWTANSASAVSSVQDEVYNGSYSLKITATSAGWALATYDFNTEIGEVYNISIYAKAASSKTPGFFQWDGFSDFQSQGISSSNWTLYSFSVTASASTATIKVYTGNTYPAAIGDAAYIDYISIQKASSDTQAPTAPVVSSNGQTQTTVDLSWTASTENVGVTGYKVYRDGTEIESNNTTTSYQ